MASNFHDSRQLRRRPGIDTRLYDVDAHEWLLVRLRAAAIARYLNST
jgi:hypothetical protein